MSKRQLDKMTTMAPKKDDEGAFFTGHAIAFRRFDGAEGVLMAGTLKNLESLHGQLLNFPADWSKAARVVVRRQPKKASAA